MTDPCCVANEQRQAEPAHRCWPPSPLEISAVLLVSAMLTVTIRFVVFLVAGDVVADVVMSVLVAVFMAPALCVALWKDRMP